MKEKFRTEHQYQVQSNQYTEKALKDLQKHLISNYEDIQKNMSASVKKRSFL